MSTIDPSTLRDTCRPQQTPRRPSWLREPLLHFVLLGAALFAADRVFHTRAGDPLTIVVGPEVESEERELFASARGRPPNAEELRALTAVWLDNEVLYREGLAMQVDKGDSAIRERVIFKALSVVDANVKLPPVDERTLREWFESHRAKYDEPARYDFDEAVLPGTHEEAAVRALVERLNAASFGEAGADLRVFKGRPYSNLVQSYGADFAAALGAAAPASWRALASRDGWRAVRLNRQTPATAAAFETLRDIVTQDWKDAVAAEQRSAAVREMGRKYRVRFAAAAP